MARYGMVIDLSRCMGCFACVMACKAEHSTPKGVSWNRVVVEEKGEYPKARMTFTPMLCNHCDRPPCMEVCPTGATYKRPDGIVAIDPRKCIGCKYCMVACPYQARSFNDRNEGYFSEKGMTPFEKQGYSKHLAGTPSKCVFCSERVEKGKDPACVVTCPAHARIFGDLSDPRSEIAQLIHDNPTFQLLQKAGTGPSVFYIPDLKSRDE